MAWLTPSEQLSPSEQKQAMRLVMLDGLTSQAMSAMTTGAFLVAFALKIGASNFHIGLLAAIPTLVNVSQFSAIWFARAFGNRRRLTVIFSFISRLPLFLAGLAPFLFPVQIALPVVLMILFLHHIFGAISGCSWSSWMRDLIPQHQLGGFFSSRMKTALFTGVILTLVFAYLIDFIRVHHPELELSAYAGLFTGGTIIGLAGVLLLSRTAEPAMEAVSSNLMAQVRQPFRDGNFRRLISFLGTWNFAVNLAAPFFTVYLLTVLKMDLAFIMILTVISQLTTIVFLKTWGRYSDKYSNKTIIGICAPLLLLTFLGWTFTTMPEMHILTLPLLVLLHIMAGMATAGISIGTGNIGLKLSPKGNSMIYLASISFVNSLAAGIAPLAGGLFADFFTSRQLTFKLEYHSPESDLIVPFIDLQGWDFFFLFSFIIGIISLNFLNYVKEQGHVEEKQLFSELRVELTREIKNVSTFTGLRSAVFIPFSFFTQIRRRNKSSEKEAGDNQQFSK